MPANTKPLFPLTPVIGWARLTSANTATDGTGTVSTLVTAGANGQRVDTLICRAGGTNIASVLRIFINNGSTNATAANNTLYKEIALPATTADNADEIGPEIEVPLDISLPAGYKINACLGTAVAGGWSVTLPAGDY